MTKITLNNVGSLIDATTAATTINNNFNTIETASDNTLSRDGTAPNQMLASLDMNSNRILNVPDPIDAHDAVNFQALSTVSGGGTVSNIPAGGTTAQALVKNSNANYDYHWASEPVIPLTGDVTSPTGSFNTTISSNVVTNAKLAQAGAATLKGNPTASTANEQDFTIQGLTDIVSPHTLNDWIPIYNAATGLIKKVTALELVTAVSAGVTAIAGRVGAFTLSNGLSNSSNDIRLAQIGPGRMLANTTGVSATPTETNIPVINQQVFTSSGTFTTPANSTIATVYKYWVVGGGASAGSTNAAGTQAVSSGAGGAGGCMGTFTGIAASSAITVTIGAAGTTSGTAGGNGVNGGASILGLGVPPTAGGGTASNGSTTSNTITIAGAGGPASGGVTNIPGSPGHYGQICSAAVLNVYVGGDGGDGPFGLGKGGAGAASNVTVTGGNATGYGAGGGGAEGNAGAGGLGSPGIVIIEWIL